MRSHRYRDASIDDSLVPDDEAFALTITTQAPTPPLVPRMELRHARLPFHVAERAVSLPLRLRGADLLEHGVVVRAPREWRRLFVVGDEWRRATEKRRRRRVSIGVQRGVVHEFGGGCGTVTAQPVEKPFAEEDSEDKEGQEGETANDTPRDCACITLMRR